MKLAWKPITLGLLLAALCGCIKIKDELTLNSNGSGKVRIETQTSLPPEFAEGMAGQMAGVSGGGVIYPPVSEAEARKFFPAKDFRVTVTQQKADHGDVTTVIEAEFKNINALLASPYGRAHQLSVKIADGSLVVRGVTGMEAMARFAEMKNDTGMGMPMPTGTADLQKKKGEMRAEFRLTLPNAVSLATGVKEGKTAAWIVERAKCKDAEDFAQQLGSLSEARCPAEGLTLTPVTPTRLGLLPFTELVTGVADAGSPVDTNKIATAVKFVPYGLSATRTLDLSGEGGGQQSVAQLTGAVVVPPEFEPQKWGEPKLDEAVDAKGNDLKPGDANEARGFEARSWYSRMGGMEEEDGAATNQTKHMVTIPFRPPDWKINEIARIKGSIILQYFGGSQVVKLTNAIPATWITDASKMMGGGFDASEKSLNSETLTALGVSLSVQTCMAQGGMTMVMLQVAGGQAALTDAQVFDANGKPWPTLFLPQNFGGGDDSESCQIVVAGKPQPPLSLAFLASSTGAAVVVPILLEHVLFSK